MANYYEDENGEWVPVKKPLTLKSTIRNVLLEALAFTGGRQDEAARILDITPRVMDYAMKKHGISRFHDKN